MKSKLNNLQALRAFAAINVVIYHTLGNADKYGFGAHWLSYLAEWGRVGVDLFFVLSGFIMVYINRERMSTPIRFLKGRLVRIVPLYWILSFGMVIIALILPEMYNPIPEGVINHFFSSILFISQPNLDRTPIIYDGWTLEYEVLFYISMSACLIAKKDTFVYIILSVFIILSIILIDLDFLMIEFVFGIACGLWFNKIKTNKFYTILSLFFGFSALLVTTYYHPIDNDLINSRVIYWGIPSIFIVYGLASCKQISDGILTLLGDASYSIYLFQVFTISALCKLVKFTDVADYVGSDVLIILVTVITTISGVLIYKGVERPLTQFARKKLLQDRV